MSLTVQKEKFEDIMEELPWLFARQYGELVLDKDGQAANADYDRYIGLEKLGVLHCLTARDDKKLVGYFFNMVVYHLHHKGMKMSATDLLYVLPGYRHGTGLGLKLIKAGIKEMKNLGVDKMYITAKKDTRLTKVLQHMGFRGIEENYSMWIGD